MQYPGDVKKKANAKLLISFLFLKQLFSDWQFQNSDQLFFIISIN
jgi:hypothetical protein